MVVASLTDEEVAYFRERAEADIAEIDEFLEFGIRLEYRETMIKRRETAGRALKALVQNAPRTAEDQKRKDS